MFLCCYSWLDTLRREICGASHSHPRPSSSGGGAAFTIATKENKQDSSAAGGEPRDYTLRFEAKSGLSNSMRAFGDVDRAGGRVPAVSAGDLTPALDSAFLNF